jgi:LytR cell envelope-related transcriptional attenuator
MRRWVGGLAVVVALFAVSACRVLPASRRVTAPTPEATVPTRVSPSPLCPSGQTSVHLLVPDVSRITVNVYNGTSQPGLGTTVAQELTSRRIAIGAVRTADNGPYPQTIIRFGPESVGAAWLLRAYFPDARSEFDRARVGAPVDVVLGASFRNVATATEVNQAVAQLGRPVAPPGTCPVD